MLEHGNHVTINDWSAFGYALTCGKSRARLRRMWLFAGGMPEWLQAGIHRLAEMDSVPYGVTGPTSVAGFIMSYPLKAGLTGQDGPKILWVVSTPRNGGALSIQVHPLGSSDPVINLSHPANAGPGEIYPDGVPIPTAGCWHFSLQWATGHAELDLLYTS